MNQIVKVFYQDISIQILGLASYGGGFGAGGGLPFGGGFGAGGGLPVGGFSGNVFYSYIKTKIYLFNFF